MQFIEFSDHAIPYDTFLKDVASSVVKMLKEENDDPEFVSHRKACTMFGRRNVERWRKQGLIEPSKRPGRLEYRTSELRYLQRQKQDYFKP